MKYKQRPPCSDFDLGVVLRLGPLQSPTLPQKQK